MSEIGAKLAVQKLQEDKDCREESDLKFPSQLAKGSSKKKAHPLLDGLKDYH